MEFRKFAALYRKVCSPPYVVSHFSNTIIIVVVVVVVLSFYRTKTWIRSIQRNIMKKGVVVFNVKQRRMELDLSREQHMLKYYVSDNLYFLKKKYRIFLERTSSIKNSVLLIELYRDPFFKGLALAYINLFQ